MEKDNDTRNWNFTTEMDLTLDNWNFTTEMDLTFDTGSVDFFRLLEEFDSSNATNTTNTTVGNSTITDETSESQILRNTFSTYGTAFLVVIVFFCWARLRYPRAFNLRSWVEDRKSVLAENQYGFSWPWQLTLIPDDTFLDECGMDCLCFIRILKMGLKLCMMGIVCSIFLMPLYFTSPISEETKGVTDNIVRLTTGNVGPGSPRLVATVVGAYLVFGYCMFLIHQELETWFLPMRFSYLRKPFPRNYAIYLRNIPLHYQTNQGIKVFFERCLGVDVAEVHIAMKTSKLQTLVAQRADTVLRLEHAVAVEETTGVRPKHKVDSLLPVPGNLTGQKVDSIECYSSALNEQNQDIEKHIDNLRDEPDIALRALTSGEEENRSTENPSDDDGNFFNFVKSSAVGVVSNVKDSTATLAGGATDLVANAAGQAVNLIGGEEDGEIYSAGFVVFNSLSTVAAALQQTHYEKPYAMECLEAPDPDDIFWNNVGRQHKDLQLGQLFSLAATVAACLLWTIPVTFVSSLSSVEALREEIGFIDDLLDAVPLLVPVMEVLAPQLLVLLNALLPVFLEKFAQLEGPISGAMVESSLFVKLSLFMIIQTFFVSALSGAVLKELSDLLADPLSIIDLLAKSLPAQATFFMQLSVVMSVTTFAVEGLRIAPLAIALLRRFIGPRLTKKERSSTFMGLAPLNEPEDFPHADFLSNMVLFFVILLVYAVIAPLCCFVLALCFGVMISLFRHQFVYIYNRGPDTGGFMYLNFMRILMSVLLIAEITVSGLLTLKKAAAAVPMMLPLIIITVLFNSYIRQKHLTISEHLPTRLCLKQDRKNESLQMDYAFVEDAYLQPELKERLVLPELPEEQLALLGLIGADEEEGEIVVPPDIEGTGRDGVVHCRVTKINLSLTNGSGATQTTDEL